MFPLSGTPAPVQNPGAQQFNTAIPQNVLTVTVTWPVAYGVVPSRITIDGITVPSGKPGLFAWLQSGSVTTTQAVFVLSGPVFAAGYSIQITVSP